MLSGIRAVIPPGGHCDDGDVKFNQSENYVITGCALFGSPTMCVESFIRVQTLQDGWMPERDAAAGYRLNRSSLSSSDCSSSCWGQLNAGWRVLLHAVLRRRHQAYCIPGGGPYCDGGARPCCIRFPAMIRSVDVDVCEVFGKMPTSNGAINVLRRIAQ